LDKERDYDQKFNHKVNNKKLFNSVESPIPNTANFNSMASQLSKDSSVAQNTTSKEISQTNTLNLSKLKEKSKNT
jgi:hypothetical protein